MQVWVVLWSPSAKEWFVSLQSMPLGPRTAAVFFYQEDAIAFTYRLNHEELRKPFRS